METGTRQVTPHEIRAVLAQLMEKLDSQNGVQHLIDIRRMLAGREARLIRSFVPSIGELEGENLLTLIHGTEIKDDPFVGEMILQTPPTPVPLYVHIKAISVRELGLDIDGDSRASWEEVWEAAEAAGIRTPTPPAVAPSMIRCIVTDRQHHFHKVVRGFENLYFLMEPMQCSDGKQRIFRIGHGYVLNKVDPYQYFLWTTEVDARRHNFNGDDFFAVVEKIELKLAGSIEKS